MWYECRRMVVLLKNNKLRILHFNIIPFQEKMKINSSCSLLNYCHNRCLNLILHFSAQFYEEI